jgi:hypothetical protein
MLAFGVARLLQPRVDALHAAHLRDRQVRGGVVARDHHLQEHVAKRRLEARVVVAKDAGAAANVFLPDRDALVEVDRALVRHLEGQDEDGDLDHARAVEDLTIADAGGFIGREVLDPNAGFAWEITCGARQQVVKRRRLLGQQQARKREGE